jgi:hypothetical protein
VDQTINRCHSSTSEGDGTKRRAKGARRLLARLVPRGIATCRFPQIAVARSSRSAPLRSGPGSSMVEPIAPCPHKPSSRGVRPPPAPPLRVQPRNPGRRIPGCPANSALPREIFRALSGRLPRTRLRSQFSWPRRLPKARL